MSLISLKYSRLISDYRLKIIHQSATEMAACVFIDTLCGRMTIKGGLCNYILGALRLEKKDFFLLIDSSNDICYQVEINEIARNKKQAAANFEIINIQNDIVKKTYNCFIGVLKGQSAAETVERLTGLGADSIYFFRSKYSQCDIGDEKIDRFIKIAAAASSQSRRLKVPVINRLDFKDLAAFITAPRSRSFLMIEPSLYSGDSGLKEFAPEGENELYTDAASGGCDVINIISGPEGGFERSEAEGLLKLPNGRVSILNLKNVVLRAEFAPQAALAIIKNRCGDL
jgi:RsmE family RNA methyltransferase